MQAQQLAGNPEQQHESRRCRRKRSSAAAAAAAPHRDGAAGGASAWLPGCQWHRNAARQKQQERQQSPKCPSVGGGPHRGGAIGW